MFLFVLSNANEDGTGKSRINNTCTSFSPQFHKEKFFELHISTPHLSLPTVRLLIPNKLDQLIGRMIRKHV
jgi:hypothetical protein